jgi:chromosome segregation ATPase
MLINYLNNKNESLESKILELNNDKENYEKKRIELEKIINDNNQNIENLNMNLEENIKKYGDQLFRYDELNKEYLKLIDISKEKNQDDINSNLNNNESNVKKSFIELLTCLNKYRELLPFINNKLEDLEKENKSLKEQINKFNNEIKNNNLELLKVKEKENEELKKNIEINKKEKEDLISKNNIIDAEKELLKNDIMFIGEFLNSKEIKNENIDKDEGEKGDDEKLIEELLKQLIKARNIITFLSKEKE